MRAVWLTEFGGPEVLVAGDAPDPVPRDGQVLVEVGFANITFVETQFRSGAPGPFKGEPPMVPGNGVGGTVTAVGAGADPGLVGRRVVTATGGSGGYAELAAVAAAGVAPVDVVFDGVGGAVGREAFTLLGAGGRMVSFGLASVEWAGIPAGDESARHDRQDTAGGSAMKLGITLPSHGVDTSATVTEHARHAEDAGVEPVWVGDHLIPAGRPFLDATLVLAAVGAATERVRHGFGVMVLPLRETVWAAKQSASLQHLSGNRVLLGVGSGGPVHGDAAFRAVGVPFAERGRRTDEALEVLTGLVEGRPTRLTGADVTLSPGAPMPPVLVGAGPERRAARSADEWHPAFSTPDEVRAGVERLAEPADAGVHRVLGMPFPSDRRRQAELLAEAARLAAVWRTEPAEAGRTRRWRVRPAGAP